MKAFPPFSGWLIDPSTQEPYVTGRCKAVHTLLSWEDDNLGVNFEINRLQEVLERRYRFNVELWSIPSVKSHNTLLGRLREFTRSYGEENCHETLLVIYYGGHAFLNKNREHMWAW